jgi:hypothetical protein
MSPQPAEKQLQFALVARRFPCGNEHRIRPQPFHSDEDIRAYVGAARRAAVHGCTSVVEGRMPRDDRRDALVLIL